MLICGIDPTSGADSRLGMAAFNAKTLEIVVVDSAAPHVKNKKDLRRRIQDLVESLVWFLNAASISNSINEIYMEKTVMRGKGGQSLERATGAFMAATPRSAKFDFVHNTTVKKIVGGSGKSEKHQVALGLLQYFGKNESSCDKIQELIETQEWDAIDALAIAVAGYELSR